MRTKDKNVVTWVQETTNYSVAVSAPGEPSEEVTQSFIDCYEILLDSFESVFTPTEVTLWVKRQSSEKDYTNSSGDTGTDTLNVSDESGVTGELIVRTLEEHASQSEKLPLLSKIESNAMTSHVFLDQGEIDITRSSPYYYIRDGSNIIDQRPEESMWYISLRYRGESYAPDNTNAEAVFRILTGTHSDVYFDLYENEISRINAARLHNALASFRDTVDVLECETWGENLQVSPIIAEEVLTGDIGHPEMDLSLWPDVEAMKEAYRADWIQDRCTQLEDDDAETITWDCQCPDGMQPAELRARAEAAVAQWGEGHQHERVRVRCESTTVEATISDGELHWDDSE